MNSNGWSRVCPDDQQGEADCAHKKGPDPEETVMATAKKRKAPATKKLDASLASTKKRVTKKRAATKKRTTKRKASAKKK